MKNFDKKTQNVSPEREIARWNRIMEDRTDKQRVVSTVELQREGITGGKERIERERGKLSAEK